MYVVLCCFGSVKEKDVHPVFTVSVLSKSDTHS
jgi:hypothetical protein